MQYHANTHGSYQRSKDKGKLGYEDRFLAILESTTNDMDRKYVSINIALLYGPRWTSLSQLNANSALFSGSATH